MGDPNNYHKHLNPWLAERDPLKLIVLGKLQEELGECTAAAGRCILQGFDGTEPETGVPNKVWLEDEIADVLASCDRAVRRLGLDMARITERFKGKTEHFIRWDHLAEEHYGRASEVNPVGERAERPSHPTGDGE